MTEKLEEGLEREQVKCCLNQQETNDRDYENRVQRPKQDGRRGKKQPNHQKCSRSGPSTVYNLATDGTIAVGVVFARLAAVVGEGK